MSIATVPLVLLLHRRSPGPATAVFGALLTDPSNPRSDVVVLGPLQYHRIGVMEYWKVLYPDTTANRWWKFDGAVQGTRSLFA